MSHFFDEKSFSVKRQTYVGDKSSFAIIATGTGHFRVLNEDQATINGLQYGQAHSLAVLLSVDIQETDKVLIDGIDYTVQGVATHNHGSALDYQRVILTKPEAI